MLGSQYAAARVLGISQPAVWRAVHKAHKVPAEWCLVLERATAGEVTRQQLRPDLFS